MNIDILHQLFKNVMMRLINWYKALIEDVISDENKIRERRKQKKKDQKTVAESAASVQLNEHFH